MIKQVKTRRTVHQILVLLDEFEKGEIGIPEFCSIHNICKATFHKWGSRYKEKVGKPGEPTGFTTLKITGENNSSPAILFAEVKGIKIYQPVSASYLKELAIA